MKGGRDARTGSREGSHASPCVAGKADTSTPGAAEADDRASQQAGAAKAGNLPKRRKHAVLVVLVVVVTIRGPGSASPHTCAQAREGGLFTNRT